MRSCFSASLIFALVLMSVAQVAETRNAPEAIAEAQASGVSADLLASGTFLPVELSKPLDARRSKANDRIEAKTLTDVLVQGQIVVPRNTKIIGHVTDTRARSRSSPDSTVSIAFDRLLLKDHEVLLSVTIISVAPPLYGATAGNEPDNLPVSSMPGQMPRGGTLVPDRPISSNATTARYPNNIHSSSSADAPGSVNSSPNSLDATSRGVIGIKGLSLDPPGTVSVLRSNIGNVHLDSGTQLLLRVR
jgi:hypothetical protein